MATFLLLVTLLIHTSTNICCAESHYSERLRLPISSLDICVSSKVNGTITSSLQICNSLTHFSPPELSTLKWIKSSKCDGNNDQYEVECNLHQCSHASIRFYTSELCLNSGDYTEVSYPVNYCWQYNEYYYSSKCTDSSLQLELFESSDCKGKPINSSILYETCDDDNNFIEIVYCDTEPTEQTEHITYVKNKKSQISSNKVVLDWIVVGNAICCCIITLWIARKIFYNLYEFDGYRVVFSDYHNWIIEPSSSNKIYALLSTIWYMFSILLAAILFIYYPTNNSSLILNFFRISDTTWYFLYLISTLKYHANNEKSMQVMISKTCMLLLHGFIVFGWALYTVLVIIFYCSGNPSFYALQLIDQVYTLLINTLLPSMFAYLYYIGFNNFCHYWYCKMWVEYEKYGENEKVHELLISMSRTTVIVIISGVIGIIVNVQALVIFSFTYHQNQLAVWLTVRIISDGVYNVCNSLSIYIIYPFGHVLYVKLWLCKSCHPLVYESFLKRHQNEIKTGRFDIDKNRYVSLNNTRRCNCCYWQRFMMLFNIKQSEHSKGLINDKYIIELKLPNEFSKIVNDDQPSPHHYGADAGDDHRGLFDDDDDDDDDNDEDDIENPYDIHMCNRAGKQSSTYFKLSFPSINRIKTAIKTTCKSLIEGSKKLDKIKQCSINGNNQNNNHLNAQVNLPLSNTKYEREITIEEPDIENSVELTTVSQSTQYQNSSISQLNYPDERLSDQQVLELNDDINGTDIDLMPQNFDNSTDESSSESETESSSDEYIIESNLDVEWQTNFDQHFRIDTTSCIIEDCMDNTLVRIIFYIIKYNNTDKNPLSNKKYLIIKCPGTTNGSKSASKSNTTNSNDNTDKQQQNRNTNNNNSNTVNNIDGNGGGNGGGKDRDNDKNNENNKPTTLTSKKNKKKKKKKKSNPVDDDDDDDDDMRTYNTISIEIPNHIDNKLKTSDSSLIFIEDKSGTKLSFKYNKINNHYEVDKTTQSPNCNDKSMININNKANTNIQNSVNAMKKDIKNLYRRTKKRKSKNKNKKNVMNQRLSYEPNGKCRVENNIKISKKLTDDIIPSIIRENIHDIYDYMDKTTAIQLNDHTNTNIFKKGTLKIINYDFHCKDTNKILYGVIEKIMYKDRRFYKWKMVEKLFTANEIEEKYNIQQSLLPKSSTGNHKIYKNKVKNILMHPKQRNHILDQTKWTKLHVFNKDATKRTYTLSLNKEEFIESCKNYVINSDDQKQDNFQIIPTIMFDKIKNTNWIEYIWIVRIDSTQIIDIGISFKYNNNYDTIIPTAIHLVKDYIKQQHQLVQPNHDCKCLDDFKGDVITHLYVGNPNDHQNRYKMKCKENDNLKAALSQKHDDVKINQQDDNYKPNPLRLWLKSINLEQYYNNLVSVGCDDLLSLTDIKDMNDLDLMGITKEFHKRKLLRNIKTMNDNSYNNVYEPVSMINNYPNLTYNGYQNNNNYVPMNAPMDVSMNVPMNMSMNVPTPYAQPTNNIIVQPMMYVIPPHQPTLPLQPPHGFNNKQKSITQIGSRPSVPNP